MSGRGAKWRCKAGYLLGGIVGGTIPFNKFKVTRRREIGENGILVNGRRERKYKFPPSGIVAFVFPPPRKLCSSNAPTWLCHSLCPSYPAHG
jgi:hypothetical protein